MKRRLVAVLAAVLLLVGLSSRGYAFWRAGGFGTGSGSTGTAQPVTVKVATGTPSSKLVPGGSADLVVTIDNPNSFSVTIVGVAQNGSVAVAGGSGCTGANAAVSVPTRSDLGVAVGTGTQVVQIASGATMGSSSASGCQGASFQVPVTVTVRR